MKPGRLHRALHQAGIMAHPEARRCIGDNITFTLRV